MDRWAKLWEYTDGAGVVIRATNLVDVVDMHYDSGERTTLRWDERDQEWHTVEAHKRSLTE